MTKEDMLLASMSLYDTNLITAAYQDNTKANTSYIEQEENARLLSRLLQCKDDCLSDARRGKIAQNIDQILYLIIMDDIIAAITERALGVKDTKNQYISAYYVNKAI